MQKNNLRGLLYQLLHFKTKQKINNHRKLSILQVLGATKSLRNLPHASQLFNNQPAVQVSRFIHRCVKLNPTFLNSKTLRFYIIKHPEHHKYTHLISTILSAYIHQNMSFYFPSFKAININHQNSKFNTAPKNKNQRAKTESIK